MVGKIEFVLNSDLALGLEELVAELEKRIDLRVPIKMYIAGGMATHLYTATRVTSDVDAEFSVKVLLPSQLLVVTKNGQMLYLDQSYNSTFALMHEDYLEDAVRVPLGKGLIEIYALSPIDLIVSKIARLNGQDIQDIASIVVEFGISAEEIEKRAEEALIAYVGNVDRLRMNLRDVLKIARDHAT